MPQFDPYRLWLGIPPEDQPPHHYRLLGLTAFESDADVIAGAVDRQIRHVSLKQTGEWVESARKLLGELKLAETILLNSSRKAAYDQSLRAKLARSQPTAATPPVAVITQPIAPAAQPATANVPRSAAAQPVNAEPIPVQSVNFLADLTPVRETSGRARRGGKRDSKRRQLPIWARPAVLLGAGACLVVLGGVGYWLSGSGQNSTSSVARSNDTPGPSTGSPHDNPAIGSQESPNPKQKSATESASIDHTDSTPAAESPSSASTDPFERAVDKTEAPWLDLLPLVRVEQAVSGKWSIGPRGLRGSSDDSHDHFRLAVPVIAPRSMNWRSSVRGRMGPNSISACPADRLTAC